MWYSRFLDVLRCIVFCGEDDAFNNSRNHGGGYYAVQPLREDTIRVQRSSPAPARSLDANYTPLWTPPQSSLPSSPISSRPVTQTPLPSSSNAPSFASRASPSTPLRSRASASTPSIPLLSSRATSSTLTPSRATPSAHLPSSTATTTPPLPSSRTISSTLTTSRAPPSTHLPLSATTTTTTTPPLASRASPSTPLPSSRATSSTQRPPSAPSTSRASVSTSLSIRAPSLIPDNGGKSTELSGTEKKRSLPRYEIPKYLKDLIKKDRVPPVLKVPLTPSTYADYFASLLYAEDYYHEKWSNFLLSEVTLELRSRATFNNVREIQKTNMIFQMNKKAFEIDSVPERRPFVAFEIDSVPERRPFLLSRDFVFVRPSGKSTEPFKGILFRVVKSTLVLVEFEDDFHQQHSSTKKYDVSFSFNRVCLKRSHHAVSAANDPSFYKILFPAGAIPTPSFSHTPLSTRILNHEGSLPYLIEGPLSTSFTKQLSSTGNVIQDGKLSNMGSVIKDATLQIYKSVPRCRILICAPRNLTCDVLMRSLQLEIPRSKLFRANAAFRDIELVPDDIIPACLYKGECFSCPPLNELQNFEVITCTFMSSFRLHNAGISADHFTHIFLVDASSATEPEAVVALVNLVSKKTVVVVTGSSNDFPHWIRSDIARKNGLKESYFHRLLRREPYLSSDPKFITRLAQRDHNVGRHFDSDNISRICMTNEYLQ